VRNSFLKSFFLNQNKTSLALNMYFFFLLLPTPAIVTTQHEKLISF
jgi:hypothetical protein